MTKVRAAAALVSAFVALTWGAMGLLGQPKAYEFDAVDNERRFTTLETKMSEVLSQVRDIKDTQSNGQSVNYMMLLMMSGLAGEAGLRLVKGKKKDE